MEERNYQQEEINLVDLLNIMKRNRFFIAMFLVLGIVCGILMSIVQWVKNPVVNEYKAAVTVELKNADDRSNQTEVFRNIAMSTELLEMSVSKLKINSGMFKVEVQKSSIPNQFDVVVLGPDQKQAISLVSEIVSRTNVMIQDAMPMGTNQVVENARAFGSPSKISKDINVELNIVIGAILGLMTGALMVFVVRFIQGRVVSIEEIEDILGVPVLVEIVSDEHLDFISKLTKVR